ncbi:DUF6907 domain-containing protein [Nocardioides zhouii]|uniref:Uncharacterized protein n=1 Tax=Nocardioides zhouii TaxID=1168729 RepID=A0A4Q2T6Q7_9ACTN|nr:hypothetical protein [Nocardioides zhouii]RYC14556.1 hypothetical protein EUA94_00045 [Nocardioides zhouii]
MTTTAVPITQRQPLTPVRCASWCADGSGHAHQTHVEDQYCHSIMLDMAASLHVPQDAEPVTVYARKEPGEDTAYVVVRTPDDREMRLTVDEVQRLRECLEHMAWVAEQDAGARNAFEIGRDVGRDRDGA